MNDKSKNYLIILLALICVGMFLFGYNENSNFKKTKKELKEKISNLERLDDSLVSAQKIKENELVILENKFSIDSLKLDSLKEEYSEAKTNARQSERQADFYRGKYTDVKNKIIYLESHTINIAGDSLLISLSKKINP